MTYTKKKKNKIKNVNFIDHSPMELFKAKVNKLWNKYCKWTNKVKNPNWQEADQLAIYKCSFIDDVCWRHCLHFASLAYVFAHRRHHAIYKLNSEDV